MTSRGTSPLIGRDLVARAPGRRAAAGRTGRDGDDGGSDVHPGIGRRIEEPTGTRAVRLGPMAVDRVLAGRRPGLLRRRGDGHQGAGLDGPRLRAARVLLPRDRPQPAGGRPLPRPRRGVRRRHRRGARPAGPSCCPPTARRPRWCRGPASGAASWSTPCARSSPRSTTRCKVRAGKGYRIVYVGHEGHEEAVGTMAVAPDAIHLVERSERRRRPARRSHGPVALLAQTTLQPPRLGRRARRRPGALPRPVDARTRATCASPPPTASRRWPRSAGECDAVVVIGSANSSNTLALDRARHRVGLPAGATGSTAPTSCPTTSTGTVGVTAGASAPEELVDAVIARLGPAHGVEEVRVTDEDEYFPPPAGAARAARRHRHGRHRRARRAPRRLLAAPRPHRRRADVLADLGRSAGE